MSELITVSTLRRFLETLSPECDEYSVIRVIDATSVETSEVEVNHELKVMML